MNIHQKIIEEIEHLRELKTLGTSSIGKFLRQAISKVATDINSRGKIQPHERIRHDLHLYAGAKELGSGIAATTLARPDDEAPVYKVYTHDPGYEKFLSYARQNQDNPHVPKIMAVGKLPLNKERTLHIHGVKMERLQPLSLDHPLRGMMENRYRGFSGESEDVRRQIRDNTELKEKYPKFHETLTQLLDQSDYLDLHSQNIMQRKDGTPVITDPYVDSSTGQFKFSGTPIEETMREELEHLREIKTIRTAPSVRFARKAAKNSFSHKDVAQKFDNIGATPLGSGLRASVIEKPETQNKEASAIKLYSTDTAYDTYISHTRTDTKNPHHPRIFSRGTIPDSDLNFVHMEKLQPLALNHPIRKHLGGGLIGTPQIILDRLKSGEFDSLKTEYPQFHETLNKLARRVVGDGSFVPREQFDIHFGNIMQRKDGTPVITDPMVSWKDKDDIRPPTDNLPDRGGTETLKRILRRPRPSIQQDSGAEDVLNKLGNGSQHSSNQQDSGSSYGSFMSQHSSNPQTSHRQLSLFRTTVPRTDPMANFRTTVPMTKKSTLDEEAPVNNVGSGNIAGVGVGPKGEPGRNLSLMPMVRRSRDFAGKAVFSVPPKLYDEARLEKRKYQRWTKYLEENSYDELAPIREYANANPAMPIIIENEKTGAMCYVKYGRK